MRELSWIAFDISVQLGLGVLVIWGSYDLVGGKTIILQFRVSQVYGPDL